MPLGCREGGKAEEKANSLQHENNNRARAYRSESLKHALMLNQ